MISPYRPEGAAWRHQRYCMEELTSPTLARIEAIAAGGRHNYGDVTASGRSQLHLGDVHYHTTVNNDSRRRDNVGTDGTRLGPNHLEKEGLTSNARFRQSLGILLSLSAKFKTNIGSNEARSCNRHLVTLLGQITALSQSSIADNAIGNLCEDCLQDVLYRTMSIFQLTRELRVASDEGKEIWKNSYEVVFFKANSLCKDGPNVRYPTTNRAEGFPMRNLVSKNPACLLQASKL